MKHNLYAKIALELIQLVTGSKAFHSQIQKKFLMFRRWFLPILSTKSPFQAVGGHRN